MSELQLKLEPAAARSVETTLDFVLNGNEDTVRQLEAARISREEVAMALCGGRRSYTVQQVERRLDGTVRAILWSAATGTIRG